MGLRVRRLWERAGSAIVTPRGGGIFLPSHNKFHDDGYPWLKRWVVKIMLNFRFWEKSKIKIPFLMTLLPRKFSRTNLKCVGQTINNSYKRFRMIYIYIRDWITKAGLGGTNTGGWCEPSKKMTFGVWDQLWALKKRKLKLRDCNTTCYSSLPCLK